MPNGGVMKDYRVGQILFLIHDASKVVPVQVVEEVVRTTLNGREKTYIVKFPDKKETTADISKVKSKIFESKELVRNYMLENATLAIEKMVEDAANISMDIFSDVVEMRLNMLNAETDVSEETVENENVQQRATPDIIKVDLGNGKFGKLNSNDLNKIQT